MGAKPRNTSNERYVAMLRGINVGGKHRVPMAELVSTFERAGCKDVGTYIQSGNAWFRADRRRGELAAALAGAIEARFGFAVPVVVRTAAEIAALVRDPPFPDADPKHRHVGFLAASPSADAVASLDPNRSPGDAFLVRGPEIFLHLPNGVARTKLTVGYFDRRLGTTCTLRNWRTVSELAARAGG